MTDHRVLVEDGQLRGGQLRPCGLTESDLLAELRQRGVFNLGSLCYVLYQLKGQRTLVPKAGRGLGPETLCVGLKRAADWVPRAPADRRH